MPMPESHGETINLHGSLGVEARLSGEKDAFSRLVTAFSDRIKEYPGFSTVLQSFVDQTRGAKNPAQELYFGSGRSPESLSERLLGKWVSLAAESALIEGKEMPNEADGARYIQLEGAVGRMEDAIRLAHSGNKHVHLDERVVQIFADSSGDRQRQIVAALDDVNAELSRIPANIAKKTVPLALAGSMLTAACTGGIGAGSIPVSPETSGPGITEVAPAEFHPTVSQATDALQTWNNVPIPLVGGETGFMDAADVQLDTTPGDPTHLRTLSLLNADGQTVAPDVQFGVGLAELKGQKSGDVTLPFFVQIKQDGTTQILPLFIDRAVSTPQKLVYRVGVLDEQGVLHPSSQEVVIDVNPDGLTIQLRDTSKGLSAQFVHTPTAPSDAVPTEIPYAHFMRSIRGIFTGVKVAEASGLEVAEAEATATATPAATATEAATATSTKEATPAIIFGGATEPNTHAGLESAIQSSSVEAFMSRPEWAEWQKPLSPDEQDPAPLVELGYLGIHTTKAQDTTVTYSDWGVDFRGIVLVEPAGNGYTISDRYVAVFSTVVEGKLYNLTIPITYGAKTGKTDLDILPDGSFIVDDMEVPYPYGVKASVLVDLLKKPETIGTRMVISIRTANTSTKEDLHLSPDHVTLVAAMKAGKPISDIETRLTIKNLHIDHRLNPVQ